MEDKKLKISHDSMVFNRINNINWNIDHDMISTHQKQKIVKLEKSFKSLMTNKKILKENKSKKKISKLGKNHKLSKKTSQELIKEENATIKKLINNSIQRDQKKSNAFFKDKTNFDNFGLKSHELQKFFISLKENIPYINQIGFYIKLLELPKYAKIIEFLKRFGFYVTCFEDIYFSDSFIENTLVIAPSNLLYKNLDKFVSTISCAKNVFRIYVYKEDDDKYLKIKGSDTNFAFFESFSLLLDKLIVITKYCNIIKKADETLNIIGIPYSLKKNYNCLCEKHLMNFKNIPCGTLYCLEKIFMNYKENFTNQIKLEEEIKEVNEILQNPLLEKKKLEKLLEIFKKESPLFKISNIILKMNDDQFFSYFITIYDLMLRFFKNTKRTNFEKREFYRGFFVNKEIINSFKTLFEKNKSFYFTEFFFATSDRKNLSETNPNVMITITLERDYVYEYNSLFLNKNNLLSPKIIESYPFKKMKNSLKEGDIPFPSDINDNKLIEELAIPIYYPFKVVSFKNINGIYELNISSPPKFEYIDEHFLLFNKSLVQKNLDDFENDEVVGNIMDQFDVKFIDDYIPLKKRNPEYFPEIMFSKKLYENKNYLKKNDFHLDMFLENNKIIENARKQHFQLLQDEKKLKGFESLIILAHYLKNNNLLPSIQKIIFTLEQRTFVNNKESQIIVRFIFITDQEKDFICEDNLNSLDLKTEGQFLRQFFSLLGYVKELYINFHGSYLKNKKNITKGLKLVNFLKEFNQLDTIYLDLSENTYVFSILKSFLTKYENFKFMKNVVVKIEKCKIFDSDLIFLTVINTFNSLESLAIVCGNNKLTSSSISTFLAFGKILKLKKLFIQLDNNKIEERIVEDLKEKIKRDGLRVYINNQP